MKVRSNERSIEIKYFFENETCSIKWIFFIIANTQNFDLKNIQNEIERLF